MAPPATAPAAPAIELVGGVVVARADETTAIDMGVPKENIKQVWRD